MSEEAPTVTEEALSLMENSAQKMQKTVKDTKKDPLTVEDLVFIKQAVRKFAEVGPEELLAGIVDLITATLMKKSTFEAKGVIAYGLKRAWRWSGIGKSSHPFWFSGERNNELGNGYPPPPQLDRDLDPIPVCWWNDKWQKIEILHDQFLEKKEVSRNLKF